ncbi:unnamed protein product, partial [Musa textilis]
PPIAALPGKENHHPTMAAELGSKMLDLIQSLHFKASKEAQSSQRWEEAAFAVV